MSNAREAVLGRLRTNGSDQLGRSIPSQVDDTSLGREEKRQLFTQQLQAAHAEVHHLQDGDWVNWINRELPQRGVDRLLAGGAPAEALEQGMVNTIELQPYQQPIESWKEALFSHIDASVTSTEGGIASTGTVVVWPTPQEPRLMSLVPPIHIALVDSERLCDTFEQMMNADQWAERLPTNALLISGPSKTADIQQVLAYGVHGPKQLIVLLLG
ncbi:MAG: lactate utilization protein [Arenicellales bacterium]|nr:lactate utilization protein [Arenicellales bacterium]|tara:strand:+ start:143 stop:784 length:642 start_codon:yes stop_codon:yes gene_type:complete